MQNKYFGTDGIRGEMGKFPLVPSTFYKIGQGIASLLTKGTIIIGHDTRSSCLSIEKEIIQGINNPNIKIISMGVLPTPGIAYLAKKLKHIGIMISASHNASQYNGIKFFNRKGKKLSNFQENKLEEFMDKIQYPAPAKQNRSINKVNQDTDNKLKKTYIDHLTNHFFGDMMKLSKLKVVLDLANGATHNIAGEVFKALNINTVFIGHKPNGQNINEDVGSTYPAHLTQAIIKHKADIGFSFDGDGDRLIMSDSQGRIFDGDKIIAIMSQYFKTSPVVVTIMSNLGLLNFFKQNKIKYLVTSVGDRHISQAMYKNKALLGAEQSGHIIISDRTTTGDGLISAITILSILTKQKQNLHELYDIFKPYPQIMQNIPIDNNPLENPELQAKINEFNDSLTQGRILIRKSGTEQLIRIMVETPDIKSTKDTLKILKTLIMKYR